MSRGVSGGSAAEKRSAKPPPPPTPPPPRGFFRHPRGGPGCPRRCLQGGGAGALAWRIRFAYHVTGLEEPPPYPRAGVLGERECARVTGGQGFEVGTTRV